MTARIDAPALARRVVELEEALGAVLAADGEDWETTWRSVACRALEGGAA